MGLYNDYRFRSMLQAQEIQLRSPDRLSPRGCGLGTRLIRTLLNKGVGVLSLIRHVVSTHPFSTV